MEVSIGSLESLLTHAEWVALIKHIGRGDKTALTVLYDATGPLVFGLILMIVGDRAVAEELVLDVYTSVWRKADSYNQGRGTPLTWLLSIARGKAMARSGSSNGARRPETPLDPADTDDEEINELLTADDSVVLMPEQFENAGLALETMPAEQRQALELAYYEGLSAAEIAGRLGRTTDEVRLQVMRAMTNLLKPLTVAKEAGA